MSKSDDRIEMLERQVAFLARAVTELQAIVYDNELTWGIDWDVGADRTPTIYVARDRQWTCPDYPISLDDEQERPKVL